MTAIIEVGGIRAVCHGRKWTSESDALRRALDVVAPPDVIGGWEPNPDETQARAALAILGGTMIDPGKPPPVAEYPWKN